MPFEPNEEQLKKKAEEFAKVLNRKDERSGELDSGRMGINEDAAEKAARVWFSSVDDRGYLDSPDLTEPGSKERHSGIRLGSLIGMGGQNYAFSADIDFNQLYFVPFYRNIRRHEIRKERGGKIDILRYDYDAEAKEESEWFYKTGRTDSMRVLVEPVLRSRFNGGKGVVRLRRKKKDEEDTETIANIDRIKALDGMSNENLVFSAVTGKNRKDRDFNLVEKIENYIEPDEVYKKLTPYEIIDITKQIASALCTLDEFGVCHRDVKPENVFVTKIKKPVAKLADWDLLKITDREHGISSTMTHAEGIVKCSPLYSSMEQWNDTKSVDIKSDLVGLGLTATKWRTGEEPRHFPKDWSLLPGIEWQGKVYTAITEEDASYAKPIGIWGISSNIRYDGILRWYHYLGLGKGKDKLDKLNRNFYNVLAGMIVADREKRYQHPKEVIEDLEKVLKGESVRPRAAPYQVFCSSRIDIKNPKKFRERLF
mgnify:FL=1